MLDRRFLLLAGGLMLSGCATGNDATEKRSMYGRIGKIKAVPGQRDALIAALQAGSGDMPGNESYMIARDVADPDGIWIAEVWRDAESHRASLQLPQVQNVIAKARPLIAGFEQSVELDVVV